MFASIEGMGKRLDSAKLSDSNPRRRSVAGDLKSLINLKSPPVAASRRRGPMEYNPKKPLCIKHCPENVGDGDFDDIASVKWRRGFRFIDLFAGIGGIRLGFDSVGGKCVFTSEWNEEAQDTYEANLESVLTATLQISTQRIFRTTMFYWRAFPVRRSASLEIAKGSLTRAERFSST